MNNLILSLRELGPPFWRLWVGESITSFGSQLVRFALGVWVYQRTGSVVEFASLMVIGLLAQLIATPFAGNIVDRMDRRRVIVTCDCISALTSVVIIALLSFDRLAVTHLYALAVVGALVSAFLEPAAATTVGTLLKDEQLMRASGMMGLSATALGIVTPTLAGALLVMIGLEGVAILDLVTFLIGASLIWKALEALPRRASETATSIGSVLKGSWSNFGNSLKFFGQSKAMGGLLAYTVAQATMMAIAVTMSVPLVLSNHSPSGLGIVMSFAAFGALVGNILMAIFGSPERRITVVLIADASLGLCLIGLGMVSSLPGYCVLQAMAAAAGVVGGGCRFALWISHVPEDRRGSIQVVQETAVMSFTAAATLTAALLVERWLDPLLTTGHVLGDVARTLISVENGRSIAMLFVLSGVMVILVSLFAMSHKPLRSLK
jgi:MFS transporter, DHA3 family, macrolide efflux protein